MAGSQSVYVKRLTKLGFKLQKQMGKARIEALLPKTKSGEPASIAPVLKEHPGAAVSGPDLPWFMYMSGDTIVMDETRRLWICRGKEITKEELPRFTHWKVSEGK